LRSPAPIEYGLDYNLVVGVFLAQSGRYSEPCFSMRLLSVEVHGREFVNLS